MALLANPKGTRRAGRRGTTAKRKGAQAGSGLNFYPRVSSLEKKRKKAPPSGGFGHRKEIIEGGASRAHRKKRLGRWIELYLSKESIKTSWRRRKKRTSKDPETSFSGKSIISHRKYLKGR